MARRSPMPLMMIRFGFFVLCAVAAVVPAFELAPPQSWAVVPPFPEHFEGAMLQPVPLSKKERSFYARFPGSVGRFRTGTREVVFRWVTTSTRRLHSGADCFRGLGYTVEARPPEVDAGGLHWGVFLALREGESIRVRERIVSEKGDESWTDTSAWYWSTLRPSAAGPWLAVSVVEKE